VQRHVRNGMVKNEGDVQLQLPGPYPVSYRSIVPKQGECENLLVPWSLSASHMAFGSIRMEPVFMILSQSAAIAADLALDKQIAVQAIAYAELRPRLLEAGQSLGDFAEAPTSVIDNSDTGLVTPTGTWLASAATPGFTGIDYLHDDNTGRGTKSVFYRLPAGNTGLQSVFLRWTSHTNRSSKVRVEIRHAEGTSLRSVNQRSDGGQWVKLGAFPFSGDSSEGIVISNADSDGYVIADAVGLRPAAPAEDGDTDGDGISDARERVLWLDPFTSNAPFYTAVRENAHLFGLHRPDEIHELHLTNPALLGGVLSLRLSELTGSGWSAGDVFSREVDTTASRRFFRIEAP
jgi:hypothetical protein